MSHDFFCQTTNNFFKDFFISPGYLRHKNQNIKFSKENDADFSALLCKVSKLFTYFNVANKLSYWLLYHRSCCGMLT